MLLTLLRPAARYRYRVTVTEAGLNRVSCPSVMVQPNPVPGERAQVGEGPFGHAVPEVGAPAPQHSVDPFEECGQVGLC
jgi:hypothetical protein